MIGICKVADAPLSCNEGNMFAHAVATLKDGLTKVTSVLCVRYQSVVVLWVSLANTLLDLAETVTLT